MSEEKSDDFPDVESQFDQLFKHVEELSEIEDPEETPFVSRYKAIEELKAFQKKLSSYLPESATQILLHNEIHETTTSDTHSKSDESVTNNDAPNQISNELTEKQEDFLDKIAVINAKLGSIHIDTEDRPAGDRALSLALERLEDSVSSRNRSWSELLEVYNQLGVLWCHRGDFDKSASYLDKGEELYKRWKMLQNKESEPIVSSVSDSNQIMKSNDEIPISNLVISESTSALTPSSSTSTSPRRKSVESLYTLTLFYRAQLFKFQDQPDKSAQYITVTLERQYTMNEYQPIEWSVNVLQLSTYYNSIERWPQAVECLLASQFMLDKVKSGRFPGKVEEIPEDTEANQHLGWGRYYLNYLTFAKNIIQQDIDFPDLTPLLREHLFDKLDILTYNEPELTASVQPITNFEDARRVFTKTIEHLNKAKEFYVLDGYVSEHFAILQDYGNAYSALIIFESDIDRKCKMLKRRADLVENLPNQLSQQHFLGILQQATLQLGEIYYQMVELKIAAATKNGSNSIDPKKSSKINKLISKSVKYFKMFLKLFEVKDKAPERVDDENIEAYMVAHFCLARIYSKVIHHDPKVLAAYFRESLKEYQWIVDYSDRNKLEILQPEVDMSRQMIELLPVKVAALQSGKII